MRLYIFKQLALTLIFGPAGLAYTSLRTALISCLITLFAVMVAPSEVIKIWAVAIFFASMVGVFIAKNRHRKEQISNFKFSVFVGDISLRVTGKGKPQRNYHSLLKKLRRKKRRETILNTCLTVLCLAVTGVIAKPDILAKSKRYFNPESAAALASTSSDENSSNSSFILATEHETGYVIKSSNLQSGKNGPYRTKLHLSCTNNKTTLALVSDDALGTERIQVTVMLDGMKSSASHWLIDNDYHTARLPHPIASVRKLARSNDIVLKFKPFGSSEIKVANFTGSTINAAMVKTKTLCHW